MNVGESYIGESGLRVTKTRAAEPYAGPCAQTGVDAEKAAAEFRLLQVGPNVIEWKDGRRERVSDAKLSKLQSAYAWAPDF